LPDQLAGRSDAYLHVLICGTFDIDTRITAREAKPCGSISPRPPAGKAVVHRVSIVPMMPAAPISMVPVRPPVIALIGIVVALRAGGLAGRALSLMIIAGMNRPLIDDR
jgi:hypothetical protein